MFSYLGFSGSGHGGTNMQTTTTTTIVQSSMKCGDIPSVANAYVSSWTSSNYGNNYNQGPVNFTCNDGYTRVATSGQLQVFCRSGLWDPLPVCARLLFI